MITAEIAAVVLGIMASALTVTTIHFSVMYSNSKDKIAALKELMELSRIQIQGRDILLKDYSEHISELEKKLVAHQQVPVAELKLNMPDLQYTANISVNAK